MSPFNAKCRDCESELYGEDKQEIARYMIEHHNDARWPGSWTSAPCGIFDTNEIDTEGKVIKQEYLEATHNIIVDRVGIPWFDPRKERK